MTIHSTPADLLLAAGLEYAGGGARVFFLGRTKRPVANCRPCKQAGDDHDKEACGHLLCHGLYSATSDPQRIRAMREASPDGLLAIRTGAVSGLVVIDIDPDHGGQVIPWLMLPTMFNYTGSGGWHLLYRHPGVSVPCSQGRVGPGIDVRGDGGYIVAPPSIHPRTLRPYRRGVGRLIEMPPSLITACMPPEPAAAAVPTRGIPRSRPVGTRPAGTITNPQALLDALLAKVAAAPPGRRRTTLFGVSVGVGRMVAAGALSAADGYEALYAAGIAAGQPHRDAHAAIVGGFRDQGVAL